MMTDKIMVDGAPITLRKVCDDLAEGCVNYSGGENMVDSLRTLAAADVTLSALAECLAIAIEDWYVTEITDDESVLSEEPDSLRDVCDTLADGCEEHSAGTATVENLRALAAAGVTLSDLAAGLAVAVDDWYLDEVIDDYEDEDAIAVASAR